MAGMTVEKVVVDYCLKLPKGVKEYCEDDAATYAALTCPMEVPASKCMLSEKAPRDERAAEAWKNLQLVIKKKWNQAYALPDAPPATPPPAKKPSAASKPAAPAPTTTAPKQHATPSPSRPKTPTVK